MCPSPNTRLISYDWCSLRTNRISNSDAFQLRFPKGSGTSEDEADALLKSWQLLLGRYSSSAGRWGARGPWRPQGQTEEPPDELWLLPQCSTVTAERPARGAVLTEHNTHWGEGVQQEDRKEQKAQFGVTCYSLWYLKHILRILSL